MTYKTNSGYAGNESPRRRDESYDIGGKPPLPRPYDLKGAMKNLDRYGPKYSSAPELYLRTIRPSYSYKTNSYQIKRAA